LNIKIETLVRGPDKTAASTTMPKGKYTENLTFSTPNCIYANYGKLGKPSLHPHTLQTRMPWYGNSWGCPNPKAIYGAPRFDPCNLLPAVIEPSTCKP